MKKLFSLFLTIALVFATGCTDYDSQIEELQTNISELETTIAEQKDTIKEQQKTITGLRSQNTMQQETINNLNDDITKMEDEISHYESITGDSGGIVYVTKTGTKFHKKHCGALREPILTMSYSDAVDTGYTPCSKCH